LVDDSYYAFDIKEKEEFYYCLGISVNNMSHKILKVSFKEGKLHSSIYDGKEYQSLMDEFMDPENLKQGLEFMNILRDTLAKEVKAKKEYKYGEYLCHL